MKKGTWSKWTQAGFEHGSFVSGPITISVTAADSRAQNTLQNAEEHTLLGQFKLSIIV